MRDSETGREVKPCACQFEAKVAAALPERYREARLTDFSESIVQAITAWFVKPGDGLLLCGPAGTGKTHLAAAIVRACIEIGKPILFKRAAELYQRIRETYKDETGFTEEGALSEYANARLLVLDDLGAGALSDFERRYALEVLDRRLNAMRPTIVSSNWTLEEIAQRMDERVASRLSGFTLLSFTGADKREQGLAPQPFTPYHSPETDVPLSLDERRRVADECRVALPEWMKKAARGAAR